MLLRTDDVVSDPATIVRTALDMMRGKGSVVEPGSVASNYITSSAETSRS